MTDNELQNVVGGSARDVVEGAGELFMIAYESGALEYAAMLLL